MTEQQHTQDANDVLFGGGGAPSVKFDQVGVVKGGRIVEQPKVRQEREYDKNNPGNGALKFFPKSGDPILGIVLTVQTDVRDPAIENDDGKRRIFVEGQRMKEAVREAVSATGAKLEVGGVIEIAYVGDGEAASSGSNAPKLYQARYTPAPAVAANAALQQGGQPQWGQQPAPVAAAPAPTWAGIPAVPGNVAQAAPQRPAAAPVPPGIDPAVWSTLNAEQQAAMANLVGAQQQG